MAQSATAQDAGTCPAGMDLPPAQQVAVKGGVVAYLTVEGAAKASEFYARAFGAEEQYRFPGDEQGRTCHIHLYMNDASVMLSDPFPEFGCGYEKAQGFVLHMKVDGIDAKFQRAVDAGCEIVMPVQKMFWGDRYGQVRDPFGVLWSMGEPG